VSKLYGFLQLRRGIWDHVRDGRMSITEALAFIYVCSEADTRTGIWKGSAKSLSGELGIPERTARDVLEKMERSDYIRRFTIPGRHSCYPILVHKFQITDGEHNGEQLNAIDSKSPVDLAYFSRQQSVREDGEHSVEHGAAQKRKRIEKEKEKKEKIAPSAPPNVAAPLWAAFVEHRKALRRPLTDHAAELVQRKLERFAAAGHDPMQLLETAIERGWLTVFAPNEGKEKQDGKTKPSPEQRTRDNLRAAGLLN